MCLRQIKDEFFPKEGNFAGGDFDISFFKRLMNIAFCSVVGAIKSAGLTKF
jgi:hypothetical protein